jgi:MSHA pilin protein MshC
MALHLTGPAHRGRAMGFTLVEMIVTLIIIALIAAVSGPVFFNINTFREGGFYDETVSALRYAQKYAVASHCTVRVQTTATGYTLFRPAVVGNCNTPGTYTTPLTDPSGNAATFMRTAPSGVALTPADFTFSATGTASFLPTSLPINVGTRLLTVFRETGFVQTQ